METFYKYYDNFFSGLILNPTIKISSPLNLNDPFEKSISNEVAEQYKLLANKDEHLIKVKADCEAFLSECGIVSLTENPRNLLMWAHYGNDHKGVCIGYDSKFLSSIRKKATPSSRPFHYKPLKVNYDRVRFDRTTDNFNKSNGSSLLNSILLKTLTTKSDDWMYEKEHRCIIPLEWGDKMIINFPQKKEDESKYFWIIRTAISRNEIVKCDDGFYRIKNKSTIHDGLQKFISQIEEVTILKDISPKHIHSIFIGCEASTRTKVAIAKTIRENRDLLGHIKIYKYMTDLDAFALNIREDIIKGVND